MPRPKGSRNKSKVSSKTVRDILLGRFRVNELEEFLNMKDAHGVKKNLLAFYFDMIPKLMPKVQELDGLKPSSLTINLGAEEKEAKKPTKPLTIGSPEPPLQISLMDEAEA
jgi:hypothetical protein